MENALPKLNETEASDKIQAPVRALNATKSAVNQFVENSFTWAKPVGLNKTVNSALVRKLLNKTMVLAGMEDTLGIQALEPRFALASSSELISMIMVPVGNPGNAADPATGIGRVTESYMIGKYEVTIGEYVVFLNAVAKTDPHGLYDPAINSAAVSAGISRTGANGNFTYQAIGPNGAVTPSGADDTANRPITLVSWFDAARFANWMANGQPVGTQTASTTENGAYDLTNAVTPPARNEINPNTGTTPSFFLPTEDQWYKAAYYSPSLLSKIDKEGSYNRFAAQSSAIPRNTIGAGPNLVNYILASGPFTVTQQPLIKFTQNYLTNVGAMSGSVSYYGTFDQSGNVWELLDAKLKGSTVLLRGGAWTSFNSYLASTFRLFADANSPATNGGFRLAASYRSPPTAVNIDMVTVVDAGNAPDPATGMGAVAHVFKIGRTHVTIGQYAAFLNAVARKSDPHGLYNTSMATDLNVAGITRVGTKGSLSYSVMNNFGNSANRPIAFVSWFDAARFANWMANGQPVGGQNARTTENGAYNLQRFIGANILQRFEATAVPRNTINPNTHDTPTFFIPTEDEWFKAAYYKGGNNTAGYWTFCMQSNVAPTNNAALASASQPWSNYLLGAIYSVTQVPDYVVTQNYLTDADAFPESSDSTYGTLNMCGTLNQWNDLDGADTGLFRGIRGGFWAGGPITIDKQCSGQYTATYEGNDVGFRLVGPPL